MNVDILKSTVLLSAGLVLGAFMSPLPRVIAADSAPDPSTKHFVVSIDEVQKNLVTGVLFRDHYSTTVRMSDGSARTIELTPMIYDGKQSIEVKDNGDRSYVGLNPTIRSGSLLVHIRNLETVRDELVAEGWRSTDR